MGRRETSMLPHSAPKSILTTSIKRFSNQIAQDYSTDCWLEVNIFFINTISSN